jgi:hypothetical protein
MVLPYLKGLMVIDDILHIFIVHMLWCLCIQSFVLNKWYHRTFIGRHCGQIFFLFLQIFFFGEEKEGHDSPEIFSIFLLNNCGNRLWI